MDSRAFCIGLGALVGYVLSGNTSMGLLVGGGLGYVLCTQTSRVDVVYSPMPYGYGYGYGGWRGHRERPRPRRW